MMSHSIAVRGFAVAEDTQDSLKVSYSGFYIGTGKLWEPESFFSGLIDDVRIYDTALTAKEIERVANWASSERNKESDMSKGWQLETLSTPSYVWPRNRTLKTLPIFIISVKPSCDRAYKANIFSNW